MMRYLSLSICLMVALFMGMAMMTPALAQEAAPAVQALTGSPAADTPPPAAMPTLAKLFETSVYVNSCILALSVVALVLFLYLMLALTTRSFVPPRFIDNVMRMILNKQFDQAIHLCQNSSHIFSASIIQRIVENRDQDHAALMEVLSSEGRRRAELVWNRVNYLAEISNVAPLLGLLGTVIGMIKVFFTMTTRIAGEKAAQLAGGIGEAMGTTLFGLIVAIAAWAFYMLVRSRATTVLAEAEQVCHSIADHTMRVGADPRLKKIDALADAARQKIALASAARTTGVSAPQPTGFGPNP